MKGYPYLGFNLLGFGRWFTSLQKLSTVDTVKISFKLASYSTADKLGIDLSNQNVQPVFNELAVEDFSLSSIEITCFLLSFGEMPKISCCSDDLTDSNLLLSGDC